eukprot:scaffold790_cov119-Amphora_coffeaeformis.AAC.1
MGSPFERLNELTLSVDTPDVSAEDAWEIYGGEPEFANVVFSEFKDQLEGHGKQAKHRIEQGTWEEATMQHGLCPFLMHNHQGKPNFFGSQAKPLLRQNIAANMHEQMILSELGLTSIEYQIFSVRKFKDLSN